MRIWISVDLYIPPRKRDLKSRWRRRKSRLNSLMMKTIRKERRSLRKREPKGHNQMSNNSQFKFSQILLKSRSTNKILNNSRTTKKIRARKARVKSRKKNLSNRSRNQSQRSRSKRSRAKKRRKSKAMNKMKTMKRKVRNKIRRNNRKRERVRLVGSWWISTSKRHFWMCSNWPKLKLSYLSIVVDFSATIWFWLAPKESSLRSKILLTRN